MLAVCSRQACLKVGRAWIWRRFPSLGEWKAAPLLHWSWADREVGSSRRVELSWKRSQESEWRELCGKTKRGGRTGLILAWWPHASWGPEWPIVVETCVSSHLCVTLLHPGRRSSGGSGLFPEQRTCSQALTYTRRLNCSSQIPGPNSIIFFILKFASTLPGPDGVIVWQQNKKLTIKTYFSPEGSASAVADSSNTDKQRSKRRGRQATTDLEVVLDAFLNFCDEYRYISTSKHLLFSNISIRFGALRLHSLCVCLLSGSLWHLNLSIDTHTQSTYVVHVTGGTLGPGSPGQAVVEVLSLPYMGALVRAASRVWSRYVEGVLLCSVVQQMPVLCTQTNSEGILQNA